ncbi:uncharacterized protein SAPINGB_P005080 [Magnusiomyces paraingens]|uniref:BHLH domain-containing protein n=1 Tax=Magnusiomyces paraingens TaxID=2606893 RepID=A0A5E8C3A0_9ASCO|nr:uncharacterized protein SAPINGB_P005080 [Saprochaete ingens]VVT56471.1 unnamed protein product [Saprochaete ingens]
MANYYSKSLDSEPRSKRQKNFQEEDAEGTEDEKIIKTQPEDETTAEDLIDNEIIQHQQQQEEQEKAAQEEQRKSNKRTREETKPTELGGVSATAAAAAAAVSASVNELQENEEHESAGAADNTGVNGSTSGEKVDNESPSVKDSRVVSSDQQASLASSLLAATATAALRSSNGTENLTPTPLTAPQSMSGSPVPQSQSQSQQSHGVPGSSHHGLPPSHNGLSAATTSGLQSPHHAATTSTSTHLAMAAAAASQYAQHNSQIHAQHQQLTQQQQVAALAQQQQGGVLGHPTISPHKPPVGSDEWHRQRRDNHKEVERRRRETINDGIRELAEIVPNCDKNKGQILRRAVEYIRELKESETDRIEKWTLDKLLSEQAISEYSATNDKLKNELELAWREVAAWKKACTDAGIMKPADIQ